MGHGYWTRDSFVSYSAQNGRHVDARGLLDESLGETQLFTQCCLHPKLSPKNVMRECCDTEEHPETIPVLLALDVTGSMGVAAAQVARKLNEVMTLLYDRVKDVEFMVMGIGDLAYDKAPIQISQYESDIRIAEQLDRVYLEHGGGGNGYESYTAAWYMGLYHTSLDCWKRGKKGLIITMGDEQLNPYLPKEPLARVTGDPLKKDVETEALYRRAAEKFEIYHLHVNHTPSDRYWDKAERTFGGQLPEGHLRRVDLKSITGEIVEIVTRHAEQQPEAEKKKGFIFW